VSAPEFRSDPLRYAAAIAGGYALFGLLWILLSDYALTLTLRDPAVAARAQSLKGSGFILLTAALLFVGLWRLESRRQRLLDEQRRLVAEAAAADRAYRDLVESSPAGIFRLSPDGRLLAINPAMAESAGYDTPAAALAEAGEAPARLFADPSQFDRLLDRLRREDAATPFEIATRGRDGQRRTMLVTARTIRGPDGAPLHYEGTMVDVTARQRAEADLARAREVLARQERLSTLGELASAVAHDFNNALTPIQGYAELLEDEVRATGQPEKIARYATLIRRGAEDAGRVVERLRAFYRPARTRPRERTDLKAVAAETVDLTRPRWLTHAAASGCAFTVRVEDGGAPPVLADPAALREALTNLVFNAVDASPRGGEIVLRVFARDGRAVIEVADSGEGMSEEVRRRCLEPFFTTKADRGTGLGLASVARIAREHGGTVEIRSEPNRGTTVSLSFPPAG
jgi:PAS domain S-box-containing protein